MIVSQEWQARAGVRHSCSSVPWHEETDTCNLRVQLRRVPTLSRANVAVGLAGLAVALYVIAMIVAQDDNGWLWPVAGVVGGAAAVVGWLAGKPRPRGTALIAIVLGGLVFLVILGWTIWAAITGNF